MEIFEQLGVTFPESLLTMLDSTSSDTRELRLACLSFISLLCCEEAKHSPKHADQQTTSKTLSSLFETPGVASTFTRVKIWGFLFY